MYAQVLHNLVWNLIFAVSLSCLRPFRRVILHVSDFLRKRGLLVFLIIIKSTIHVYGTFFGTHHLLIVHDFDHI